MLVAILLVAFVIFAVAASSSSSSSSSSSAPNAAFAVDAVAMTLKLLPGAAATDGAVCLDGSPYGYYFAATTNAKAHANDWQIYFEGGGWCYSEIDCAARAQTDLGSSKNWPKTETDGGIMSDDCTINPDFCQFNRVYLKYCDGNSFSGNRDTPVVVNGASLYFRGHRNLNAALLDLMSTSRLAYATNVMLTGCSAGGLSTFLHADYIARFLPPTVARFRAFPISGFFLNHDSLQFTPVYPDQMQAIFELSNATGGLNQKCIADKAPAEQWLCNFAPETYKYVETPIFPLNSNYDSWQLGCIFSSVPVPANVSDNGHCNYIPAWQACVNDAENCTDAQVPQVNEFGSAFLDAYFSAKTSSLPGNGAFFHSCVTHCEAQDDTLYHQFTVNGVSMQQAVSAYWNSDGNDVAAKHTYASCLWNAAGTPRQCNPSCESGIKLDYY